MASATFRRGDGHQRRPGGLGSVLGALGMHRAASSSPDGACHCGGKLEILGRQRRCWQPDVFRRHHQGPCTSPAPHPAGYRSLQPPHPKTQVSISGTTARRISARSSTAAPSPQPSRRHRHYPSGFLPCRPPLRTKCIPYTDVYDKAATCAFFFFTLPPPVIFFNTRAVYLKNIQFLFLISTA